MSTISDELVELVERFDSVSPSESIGAFGGSGQWVELCTVADLRRFASALAARTTQAEPVADARVKRAAYEFLLHKGDRPWRVTRGGVELWEEYAPAMRHALTAALKEPT